MLKIKLARFGKRKQPRYRFVVAEANSKRDSGHVASLGFYSPTLTPKELKLDLEAYTSWIKKGAQPTATVASLAKRFESGKPFPTKKPQLSKKALAKKTQATDPAKSAKVVEPVAEPVAEPVKDQQTEIVQK